VRVRGFGGQLGWTRETPVIKVELVDIVPYCGADFWK
jgi:hypothetical protein